MGHHHHHDHTHGANKKVLLVSFIIISAYMIVEAIGGILTNSLALLSDAGHMFSDAVSLGVALLAFRLGERQADYHRTFGYKRFEILAAVFNGVTLIIIAVFIFIEAIKRFIHPPEIASAGMLLIGFIGLLVNIFIAWLMMSKGDTEENLNLRAAYLHVLGDMLGSVGAVIAGLLIMFFNWGWADPVASLIVAFLILVSGFRVTRDAIQVLMEGTPTNIDLHEVIEAIEKTPEIISIHDLHVWSITSGVNALSCHAVVNRNLTVEESQDVLQLIEEKLKDKGIVHVTIQIESKDHMHDESILCQLGEDVSHIRHEH